MLLDFLQGVCQAPVPLNLAQSGAILESLHCVYNQFGVTFHDGICHPFMLRISRPISRAPNSAALLVEFPILPVYNQIMLPSLSLITPPIPVIPGFPFAAPSKFNLRDPAGGGFQLCSPIWSCGSRLT
jgi:hypothetical protein